MSGCSPEAHPTTAKAPRNAPAVRSAKRPACSSPPNRVAFVLDATSPKGEQHLFEIIFAASEEDPTTSPCGMEGQLAPSFIPLAHLADLTLLPPIGEQLREFATQSPNSAVATATYLGNVWQPIAEVTRLVSLRSMGRRVTCLAVVARRSGRSPPTGSFGGPPPATRRGLSWSPRARSSCCSR